MQQRGRPEEWRVDPDSPIRKHVLQVDRRGRITLGVGLVEDVGRELLGVLNVPGRVRLLPWKPHGEQVRRRSAMLANSLAENVEALQDLHSVYERVTVDSQGRFVLPPGARLHLGVAHGPVIVWQLPKAIELWSPAFRDGRLPEDVDDLLDSS
jgi:DNA-binding transcriptional regulator/RsmH inhibitor MraZ